MKLSTAIHQHFRTALMGGLLLAGGSAQAISLTSGHTGSWFNPNQDGQGFAIEVVPGANPNEKQAVVYWYTFDASGNPTWFFGAGPITDNMANITLYQANGGTMGQAGQADKSQWGTMQLDFSSCENGQVSYQSDQASGQFTIERITQVFGDVCTGTLVDDLPEDMQEMEQIRAELYAMAGQGRGMTELELEQARSKFSIEVYDLPAGTYDVLVGGEVRGQIEVMAKSSNGEGEIEFVSPADNGQPLLDFDPRGMEVVIAQGGNPILSTTMPEQSSASDGSNDDSSHVDQGPNTGNSELEIRLDRMSMDAMYAQTTASAQLEREPEYVEFEVKMRNAPAGIYELQVDGVVRGVIEVMPYGSVTAGEIQFRDPVRPGYELLDFDPTGTVVSILDENGVVMEGFMDPAVEQSDADDDSGNHDDNDHNDDGDSSNEGDHDDSGNGDDDCVGMNCGG